MLINADVSVDKIAALLQKNVITFLAKGET